MRTRSLKGAALDRKYSLLRHRFLLNNPYCIPHKEVQVAIRGGNVDMYLGAPSTEIHHCAGREHWLLLYVQAWIPVCASCHRFITDHGTWAKEHGYKYELSRDLALDTSQ